MNTYLFTLTLATCFDLVCPHRAMLSKYENVKVYKCKVSCLSLLGMRSRYLTVLFRIIRSYRCFENCDGAYSVLRKRDRFVRRNQRTKIQSILQTILVYTLHHTLTTKTRTTTVSTASHRSLKHALSQPALLVTVHSNTHYHSQALLVTTHSNTHCTANS